MNTPNPKVDWFFNKATPWQEEYKALRTIVLSCGLVEELKWGCPCYTLKRNNVVLIHGFKEYCALLFHKGALLSVCTWGKIPRFLGEDFGVIFSN